MLYRLTMNYISSKISMLVGVVLGVPSTILALLQGESTTALQSVTLVLGIAGGVLAFLWAARKFPIEQRLKEAAEIFLENVRLRKLNTELAEQNERYRVRLANLEESQEHLRPHIEPGHD